MKTAVLIHGMPSKEEYLKPENGSASHNHWFAWLQRQLVLGGVLTQTPEMPEPYDPDYEQWKTVFEQFKVDENTDLVGHSCGGGFLVRWLSENKVRVGKVALVAPWTDPNHTLAPKMFSNWEIDEGLASRTKEICLFISSDDDQEELDTAEILKQKIPGLKVKQFSDRGHFTLHDMQTKEFPELRDFLLL
jgi:predicted alpha/beta hydrolase family esterase